MEQRKKFMAALSLFLVCVLLMLYTTYAWVVVSSVPEVNNIETNVGSNGSLEIALLNNDTFIDPSTIRTVPGSSMVAQDPTLSNITWGNLVDLSAESYGLQEITLRPSRLNLTVDEAGNAIVNNHILMMADYGKDGRVSFISGNTVSGIFADNRFSFNSEFQTHGVRGIGVAEHLSTRQKAFASAVSLLPMYNNSAIRTAQSIWLENGPALMNMWWEGQVYGVHPDLYTSEEHTAILDMAKKTLESYDYVDNAVRNSMIGFASIQLEDDDTFEWFLQLASKPDITTYELATMIPDGMMSGLASSYLSDLEELREYLQQYIRVAEDFQPDSEGYYWDPLAAVFLEEAGFWGSYLNGSKLHYGDPAALDNLMDDNELILHNASLLSSLAIFTGNYSTSFSWDNRNVEVSTAQSLSNANTPFLPFLTGKLEKLTPPEASVLAEIFDLYGFAIDMAFRCNTTTNLLLQTEQELRLRETTELPVTQGGGSYVCFKSNDMTSEQVVSLVDTIRLGFLDNRGHLVALAKPNISNYKEDLDESITAPLYLYEFTVSASGSIVPGERRSEDTGILSLTQNSPEHLTVIIWMDGDYVDNSMVSIVNKAMTGVVNLQFASSVDLNPAAIPIQGTE